MDKEIRIKSPSGLIHLVDYFTLILSITLLTALTQATRLFAPYLAITYIVDRMTMRWEKTEARSAAWFIIISSAATGFHMAGPPALMLISLWDQKKLIMGEWFVTQSITAIIAIVGDWTVPLSMPLAGGNGLSPIMIIRDFMDVKIQELRNNLDWGLCTEVTYLRPNGLAEYPIELSSRPALRAKETVAKYKELSQQTRLAILGVFLVAIFMVAGPVGLFIGIVMLGIAQMEKEDDNERYFEKNAGLKFKNGTYRVSTHVLGFEADRGIGTAHNGVLHVPFHVTKGRPVLNGKAKVFPYYINIHQDIVTYGGPQQVDILAPGDEVYINCETDATRTSYRVKVDYESLGNILSWQGVTEPGESGSPIWAQREDQLILLGLAGRYVKDRTGTTEFSNVTPTQETRSNYRSITLHPGAGKTWKMIPQLIQENLTALKGKRILVTGPTRVVCKELHSSLSRMVDTGLNIKDSTARNEHAQVQIAAHRTALKMLITKARALRNVGMIIIDEAHYDDPSTKLLRRYARGQEAKGISIVELSATLDGLTNTNSNYDIREEVIGSNDIESKAREELAAGNRVMIFVSSIKSKLAQALMINLKEYAPVLLSRDTFEPGMAAVADEERRLIISTDISECGINVPGLDVVIDTGVKFGYANIDGIITGVEMGISPASRTQRRGRVGRVKKGTYYEVRTKLRTDYETAAECDARVLSVGRNWTDDTVEWPFTLTDQQFEKWLDSDATPLEVWVNYDTQGVKRAPSARTEKWNEIRSGEIYYIGCRDEECKRCAGTYSTFDERSHKAFYGR
ncbi:NS3-like protein [Wuhan flea virus]|uniref:NS3-like protein n=1 Tax=Wuhan flea virus TaxID=1746071 RepID=UPI000705F0B4|nr:NS3-like protein [Wuhan flea virus]ALL52913.1 NS3-like protein [Wuhan flea virus]